MEDLRNDWAFGLRVGCLEELTGRGGNTGIGEVRIVR